MAVVELSKGKRFFLKHDTVIFPFGEFQPVYATVEQKLGVNFKKYGDVKFIQIIENCLLILEKRLLIF